jgi:HEAT repeat protein
MIAVRKLIFIVLAATLVLGGCDWFQKDSSPSEGGGPRLANQSRVDRLVLRLGAEEIKAGPVGSGRAFFAGEFDRHLCPAIDELVAIGEPAVARLRETLSHANPVTCRNAAFALARLGDPVAASHLYTVAEDANKTPPVIRARAIDLIIALSRISREQAPTDFARLATLFDTESRQTRSRSRHVQVACLRAAAADGSPEARELVLGNISSRDRAIRCAAIEALGSFEGTQPPNAVLAALDDRNPRLVAAAMRTVARLKGDTLCDRFARLIGHSDPSVRIEAIRLVAELKPPEGGELLVSALDDSDIAVQREVVVAMETLGDASALDRGLENRRWRVRAASVAALGRLKSATSLAAMGELADDKSFNVRTALAIAVGRIGHPAGARVLVRLLRDSASTVRRAARDAFGRVTGDALEDYNPAAPPWQNAEAIGRAEKWANEHAKPLPARGTSANTAEANDPKLKDIRTLVDALALPPGKTRQLAVAALIAQGQKVAAVLEEELDRRPTAVANALLDDVLPVVDPFYMDLTNLDHEDTSRRRQAAIRFARQARSRKVPKAVWPRVRRSLSGETDGLVRRLLAERLVAVGDPGAADVLIEGLKVDDVRSRQAAALHLGQLKSRKAVAPLVKALEDERTQVQYAAAWALGEIGDTSAVKPLEQMLATRDIAGRIAVGAALAKLGVENGRDELIRLMVETATTTQVAAAEAMVEAPHEAYIPMLIEKLDPNNVRLTTAATAALRKITGKKFGYQSRAVKAVRDRAITDWRQWFETTQKVKVLGR